MKLHWSKLVLIGLFAAGTAVSLRADPLDKIAKKISKASSRLKNKQIAVLPFPYHDGREGEGSTIISERLVTKIVNRGKLRVVERSLLEKVLMELNLQYSGVISQGSAKDLGNILGVEAILTGTLIDLGGDQIEINARLIDAETGLVLTATSEKQVRQWSEKTRVVKVEPMHTKTKAWTASRSGSKEDTRKKMSAFFHSREPRDSVVKTREQYVKNPEPSRNVSASAAAPRSGSGAVLSNVSEDTVSGAIGVITLADPPASFFEGSSNIPGPRAPAEFKMIRQTWELIEERKYVAATENFSKLAKEFYRAGKKRYWTLAQIYLAEAYFRRGNYDRAINEVRRVSRYSRNFPKMQAHALFILARSYEEDGRLKMAVRRYRQIVQKYPFESRLIRSSGYRMRQLSRN